MNRKEIGKKTRDYGKSFEKSTSLSFLKTTSCYHAAIPALSSEQGGDKIVLMKSGFNFLVEVKHTTKNKFSYASLFKEHQLRALKNFQEFADHFYGLTIVQFKEFNRVFIADIFSVGRYINKNEKLTIYIDDFIEGNINCYEAKYIGEHENYKYYDFNGLEKHLVGVNQK